LLGTSRTAFTGGVGGEAVLLVALELGVVTVGVATAGRLGLDGEGTREVGGVEHPVISRIVAVNPMPRSQILRTSSR